ncbi:hypothetical protein [Novosphingobium capsulatum]|uniref:hypothetical protein n=1 Tax=Novosphingobium capsulatum TaxID=13688 RepID=UPI000AE4B620|nr:hypothetical protein [Novosphingobium capsulatum]WQD92581.1 hypothetical protein U0041_16560 [Novosphingobium capsulatum]
MQTAHAPSKFRQSDIRRAIGAVAGMGFEAIRVAIRLDGSLEVTVRRNALDDTQGEELD